MTCFPYLCCQKPKSGEFTSTGEFISLALRYLESTFIGACASNNEEI